MKNSLLCAALWLAVPALAQDDAQDKAPVNGEQQPLDVEKLPFTPDSIRMVIERAQPQIQGCYEEFLAARKKPVEGSIKTKFTITPQGLVKKALVVREGTTLFNTKLHACVTQVLTALTFPKPADGRDYPIEFPFNLKAVK